MAGTADTEPPTLRPEVSPGDAAAGEEQQTVLVVDDEPAICDLIASQLSFLGLTVRTARDGSTALALLDAQPTPTLVLSDMEMPGLSGLELLRAIRQRDEQVQVVMISGLQDLDTVRQCLREGAYDYLVKPFEFEELSHTVRRAIDRRRLIRQNIEYRDNLERMVLEQTEEIRQTRDIALVTLAKLAESRDAETGLHLERMAAYCRSLAEALREGPYQRTLDRAFVDSLFKSAPLHDIGKVGIPDAILRKPGPLDEEERAIMRTHTSIGGDTLASVASRYSGYSFLDMAIEIAYAHHERWDGSGYPRGLAGEDIPLAARIVALADAYDAIRSRRPYKHALDHEEAVHRIVGARSTHFDPVIVEAFERTATELEEIQRQLEDRDDGRQHHAVPDLDGGPASR